MMYLTRGGGVWWLNDVGLLLGSLLRDVRIRLGPRRYLCYLGETPEFMYMIYLIWTGLC